ncbi:MAG: hypothetical protein DBX47_00130 [Clostridiales bacterium]|nr:MAG: hypothetical protein DBX47_00130 [Clostridiales bacterium]
MKKSVFLIILCAFVFSITSACSVVRTDVDFYINAEEQGKKIKNINGVANQFVFWDSNIDGYEKDYIKNRYPFIEYMQFMTATGGNANYDLFDDPLNRDVTNDYNFTRLLSNLRRAVDKGAVPWVKTGVVPLKLSENPKLGTFGVNIREPYDYNLYYDYIKAMAQAIIDEFGAEEVSKWRWGVFTEFNNPDWFIPNDGKDAIVEFCKIYDYTVKALEDVLGKDIFVGAHGLFSIDNFIIHCGTGTNYATGEIGSHIDYIADSYYTQTPTVGAGYLPHKKLAHMRDVAQSVGLTNIVYGIDEGRILDGTDKKPLTDRKVGYSIQAANDAYFLHDFIDNDLDYFSSWSYSSTGLFGGIDTVSLHVANCFNKMVGSNRVTVNPSYHTTNKTYEHNNAFSAFNTDTNTLSVMAYHYYEGAYAARYKNTENMRFTINIPQLEGNVKITKYVINDSSNFFDDWVADWKELGIDSDSAADDVFDWSKDSAQCQTTQCIKDPKIYQEFLNRVPEYTEAAKLIPITEMATVVDGKITLSHTTSGQEVVFFTIAKDQ